MSNIDNNDKTVSDASQDDKRANNPSRRTILKIGLAGAGAVAAGGALYWLTGGFISPPAPTPTPVPTATPVPMPRSPLDPRSIPKFVNQFVVPPAHAAGADGVYAVEASQFTQQILPPVKADGSPTGFGPTTVWGYGGKIKDANGQLVDFRHSPAATFEAVRGVPTKVKWANRITGPHLYAVDPTLHWADPNNIGMGGMAMAGSWPAYPPGEPKAQSPVPNVPHLHGGEVESIYDGGPDAWFTADGKTGPTYKSSEYVYLNAQPPTTLWYHDHAMGMTRLNVMAGLAGFYLLRDPNDTLAPLLPSGKYEVPIAIQDRKFWSTNAEGNNDLLFDSDGINPDVHPYWTPEFFGDAIMVNGRVWPNLDVDQGQYRFRVLDGSNARFYRLKFSNGMSFVIIGTEGGYLKAPVAATELFIAPGERYDILVDFSNFAAGTRIVLTNDANAPYPDGDPVDPETTGQIMQFTVTDKKGHAPAQLPAQLNPYLPGPYFPTISAGTTTRVLTLNEIMGQNGPLMVVLNGQKYDAPVSELPKLGTTEEWVFVNTTADTHPMHLHLVQFQLIERQDFDAEKYLADWLKANADGLGPDGMLPLTKPTVVLPFEPYLSGQATGPEPYEQGWKDTVKSHHGQITRIRVRFAPVDGSKDYPFDATNGPGYVWHCHIVDHEDNEMMRPYKVTK